MLGGPVKSAHNASKGEPFPTAATRFQRAEFRRPAINQELLLAALEEEGWPTRIDEPLSRTPDIDPKVRIHDAIKALNRCHLGTSPVS